MAALAQDISPSRASRAWIVDSRRSSSPSEEETVQNACETTVREERGRTLSVVEYSLPLGGIRRLQFQADTLLRNCHGDWTEGSIARVRYLLQEFVEHGNQTKAYHVFQVVKFCESMMDYADSLLAACNIKPAYTSTRCLDWDDDVWFTMATHRNKDKSFDRALKELQKRDCEFWPSDEQGGPRSQRPLRYIAASLVNANLSKAEEYKKIKEIANFIAEDVRDA